MGSVTISGKAFEVYGTEAGADDYHKASLGSAADAWAAATADTQNKAHVQASRLLDRQRWKGLPVGTPQIDVVLEWPRTGVTDRYGNSVSSASIPDDVLAAAYELAAMIVEDNSLPDQATSGSNVQSVQAGSAQVSFFRPTLGITGKFPTRIQELISQYLESGSSIAGEAFGVDDVESAFDTDDAYSVDRSV